MDRGRRRFLKIGALAGTGLMVGAYFGTGGEREKALPDIWSGRPDGFRPNAWIHIDGLDNVTVRVNHSEMGQGITTALAMIIAEELEADWSKIRVEIAPADAVYKNPAFNSQMTAASTSVCTSWDPLRRAGAAAREMLMESAALMWSVPKRECRAVRGSVVHSPTGHSLRYGQLVGKAASLPLPKNVRLKRPDQFEIIGKKIPRIDTPAKTDGSALFGIDVKLPGLLTATVVHPPVFGTAMRNFDAGPVKDLAGVSHVLAIDTGIAVVADTFWNTCKGVEALRVKWESSDAERLDSRDLGRRWAGLAQQKGKSIFERGNPQKSLNQASRTISSVYELPYQAHATPEPMNCTAHVYENGCEIWVPTQNQDATQEAAAGITGLAYKDIKVHTTFLGGGFGRRVVVDYVKEAVQISKAVKAPVKVIWTREEDIQHDFYRPATYNVLRAGLNEDGYPVAWTHRIVGPDHMARMLPELAPSMLPYWVPRGARDIVASLAHTLAPRVIPGKKAAEGAAPLAYAIDNVGVDYVRDDPGIPTGFWRSVAHSQNAFIVESFLDEIAAAAGKDPFDLRRELLRDAPRLKNVLRLAAEKSSWWKNPTAGIFRGMAAHDFHGTMLCFVAEVSVGDGGEIRVHRVVCAVDCGIAINPKIIEAQIRSGIVFGLTATLKSAVTIRHGRVEQSNFDDFPLLRMDEMPGVEVHIVPSTDPPTGIGEAAVPMIAPAVTNAIFAATGKRIRRIPIEPDDLRKT